MILSEKDQGLVVQSPISTNPGLTLKLVRNSFPFSIPTELYERLTHL